MNNHETKFLIYVMLLSLFVSNLDIATNTAIIRKIPRYSIMEKLKLIVFEWIHAIIWITIFTSIILSILNLSGFYRSTQLIYMVTFVLLIIVTLLWFVFKNRCILTLKMNQLLDIHPDCQYRNPLMVLKNEKTEKLRQDSKYKDYGINFMIIFMLAYILWNRRWI